ncbi:MAG: GAF domain-containing protein [Bacteroidales bacterium]|nr:GAF domain-containing protein [Bacteroidales bacterium]
MRKINIRVILLVSFSLISLIVLISGVREIIILNKLHNLNNFSKNLYKDQTYLNESLILINTDYLLLQRIINTQNYNEYESLKSEHENYVQGINENSKKIFTQKSDFKDVNELNELNELFKESIALYKNDYLKKFNLIIDKKGNLLNIDNYFVENLNLNNNQSKAQIIKSLNNDIFNINSQTDRLFEDIKNNLSSIVQESKQLINNNEELSNKRFTRSENITVIFFLIIIIFSFVILILLIRTVIRPIEKIQNQLNIITQGELPGDIHIDTGGEIRKMAVSINKLIAGLKRGADFSLEIGKGNFDTRYNPLSDNDVLGNSLLTLRDNLQTAQVEEEKRKTEDAQRNRTNEGLTIFSEILRQQTGNISDLADDIISSLVKFMNANQGALFFLNEDDKDNIHYELIGAYAYNRKKYLSKQIKPGEGLVGAVAIEKYTVYMTDIPDEYIEVESGTGSANPRSIIIVPLKIAENVLGVIELASFKEFETYEIEMVEKIAESIASSLANARINMQTALLLEKSKDQEVQMEDQERELRQNIEELKKLSKGVNILDSVKAENEMLKVRLKRFANIKEEFDKLRAENDLLKVRLKRQSKKKDETETASAEIEMLKVRLKRFANVKEELDKIRAENDLLKVRLKRQSKKTEISEKKDAEKEMLKVRLKRETKSKDEIDALKAENELLKVRLKRAEKE